MGLTKSHDGEGVRNRLSACAGAPEPECPRQLAVVLAVCTLALAVCVALISTAELRAALPVAMYGLGSGEEDDADQSQFTAFESMDGSVDVKTGEPVLPGDLLTSTTSTSSRRLLKRRKLRKPWKRWRMPSLWPARSTRSSRRSRTMSLTIPLTLLSSRLRSRWVVKKRDGANCRRGLTRSQYPSWTARVLEWV